MDADSALLQVGEGRFPLGRKDRGALVLELWASAVPGGGYETAARKLEQPGGDSPLVFTVVELGAMHRALSNLRSAGRIDGRDDMLGLLDALTEVVEPQVVEYELRLEGAGEPASVDWTSFSGTLEVGDRLRLPDGDWRVAAVEPHRLRHAQLVCRPFDPEDSLLPPEVREG